MAIRIPMAYMPRTAAYGVSGKNIEAIVIYIGSLALQDIYGISIMVRYLFLLSPMEAQDSMAGTEQPKPIIRWAAVPLMIPDSFRSEIKNMATAMVGIKESTL